MMGKAERLRLAREPGREPAGSGRVQLTPEEFFRLIAAARQAELVRQEAQQQAAQRIAEANQVPLALFDALSQKYGFDKTQPWHWDETTCELIQGPAPRPGSANGAAS
jgi:hypothetical protein